MTTYITHTKVILSITIKIHEALQNASSRLFKCHFTFQYLQANVPQYEDDMFSSIMSTSCGSTSESTPDFNIKVIVEGCRQF